MLVSGRVVMHESYNGRGIVIVMSITGSRPSTKQFLDSED